MDKIDKAVQSPPPDDHDILIQVPELSPSIDVPIPDRPEIRRAFAERLGRPVDDEAVDDFLHKVWSEEARRESEEAES
ncbi:hypothetical protein [Rhodococcus aetherivorans]|uniref:hypothetical protein n=1 Tax=Rhodococcus aetherivorans TaxID=191292 RepID=UPI001E35C867|nr:hypothetical protein [Rhodococcus aetherivorans]UGQ39392.1 hypothetical protein LRQ66_14340 [Rhodococcus aetherivorans]